MAPDFQQETKPSLPFPSRGLGKPCWLVVHVELTRLVKQSGSALQLYFS